MATITTQIAKHFREAYFGGNWCCVNLKEELADITWQEATTKVFDFNTIAILTCHINYYVSNVLEFLKGHPLTSRDHLSFVHPPIHNQEDWKNILSTIYEDGEEFASLIEQLSDEKLMDIFIEDKYGIYYRNLHGIIEHVHYHLGQIVLVKKIIRKQQINA